MKNEKIDTLTLHTIAYFKGDPSSIQHFLKVHAFASLIGRKENLPEKKQLILEAAALVHDVGIPPAMAKYGSGSGNLQEKEGPPVARKLMESAGFSEEETERVAYLVGHHHTYTEIDGPDYQILVEADFLVNLYEGGSSRETIEATEKNIFRTKTGREILKRMFEKEKKEGTDPSRK